MTATSIFEALNKMHLLNIRLSWLSQPRRVPKAWITQSQRLLNNIVGLGLKLANVSIPTGKQGIKFYYK